MNRPTHLDLSDFQYELPADRIAKFPLADRDQSRLLVYNGGKITHSQFLRLADFLPVNATLFFNDTRVIPARLLFEKPTGGTIEVFLLNPANAITVGEALTTQSPVTWQCTVGNAKRWPDSLTLVKTVADSKLSATWSDRSLGLVTFSWNPAQTQFAAIVEATGAMPLPPYLNRAPEQSDRERYQTVYSKFEGAVAAPTAGLHFTPAVMGELDRKKIRTDFLTLHVSAGTFLPIKSANAAEHRMHREEIIVRKSNLINLLDRGREVIAVGTTALRSLESLYWYGIRLASDPDAAFEIEQDLPYRVPEPTLSKEDAISHVLQRFERSGGRELVGHTALYVMPGYRFRVTRGLITNFHQPGSSLVVLVAALIGDAWKTVYREAMSRNYRFLSYGDSSLLLP